jgi:AcrR family transcriptional regulator
MADEHNAAERPTPAKRGASARAHEKGSDDKRLRHPTGGGYARGEETRLRIIEASIEVFGERGYDAATTREIALRAGVNPPALQYYFESKEGVYIACSEHIACSSNERFTPVLDRINVAMDAGVRGEEAIELFCVLQETIIDHLMGLGDMRSRRLFMAREESGHTPNIGTGRTAKQKLGAYINATSSRIIAVLSGAPADDPATKLKAMMLFGQTLVFHVARPSAMATLGWTDLDADKLLLIKQAVREQTQTVLRALVR